jgi:hypothetical protein
MSASESVSNKINREKEANDYLDEYDEYYLEHEKYIEGGNGGKQRTKRDQVLNTRNDPSGNVRIITQNLKNSIEHNKKK